MKTVEVKARSAGHFTNAKNAADSVAAEFLKEGVIVSWKDSNHSLCSPSDSIYCDRGEDPYTYAKSNGAQLMVDVNTGAFLFYYRDGEKFSTVTRSTNRVQVEDVPGYLA